MRPFIPEVETSPGRPESGFQTYAAMGSSVAWRSAGGGGPVGIGGGSAMGAWRSAPLCPRWYALCRATEGCDNKFRLGR
jgi:hypothetical protein